MFKEKRHERSCGEIRNRVKGSWSGERVLGLALVFHSNELRSYQQFIKKKPSFSSGKKFPSFTNETESCKNIDIR